MAVATVGPERLAANFTLHRSETVAHSAHLLDRKNTAASSRARGRSEGFACKHSDAFKPLGAPVTSERITEMHNSTLGKVAKIEAAVKGEANSQHQDKKDKERNKRIERQMKEHIERLASPDVKDAKDEQAAEEASLEADREMLSLTQLPHALYGKDLPRCGQAQERQEKDGFKHLKMHIKNSFRRVGQVKSDADAAFEARKENLQLMLQSPRSQRPVSPDKSTSAFLTSVDLPHSAREHRPKPARRPSVQPKAWLPSLSEYLALDGAPEREVNTHGRHKDLIKEIVQELIPLPKGPKPNWIEEGRAGGKGRWVSRRKALEKELNDSWKDKAFYKRCTPFIPQRDAEEYRRQYHDDEHKLATIERFLKDLGVTEELKETKPEERSVPDGTGSGGGTIPPDQGYSVLQEKRREDENKGHKEQPRVPEPNYVVDARARSRAIHQKARAQLREPEDPSSSSLAVLRSAVYDYQAMRDMARKKLQETLENQEKTRMADRLPQIRTPRAQEELPDNRQHHWYRSLLEHVRAHGDASKATHSILDAVKAVLDQSGEFGADDFWVCISQIDEVSSGLASLLVLMTRGISGLNAQALTGVLQQRGELTQEVLQVLSG